MDNTKLVKKLREAEELIVNLRLADDYVRSKLHNHKRRK